MPSNKPKICVYVRVSTTDKQTTKSQREVVRQWAKTNHVPASELRWNEDRISGATTDRPQLHRLLWAVEKNRLDSVIVFRLDRLARNLRNGLEILAKLGERGIQVSTAGRKFGEGR